MSQKYNQKDILMKTLTFESLARLIQLLKNIRYHILITIWHREGDCE